MELQLVNKTIAIQLKELGFNWECDVYTNIHNKHCNYGDEELYTNTERITGKAFIDRIQGEHIIKTKGEPYWLYTPTQALVCKWFRDKFDIKIYSLPYTEIDSTFNILRENRYMWMIHKCESSTKYNLLYDTYEEAEEAGILKAIEILKSK